jgi:hypothetical protein
MIAGNGSVYFLARLLHLKRVGLGTRRGTRVLGPFRQAVHRWPYQRHEGATDDS